MSTGAKTAKLLVSGVVTSDTDAVGSVVAALGLAPLVPNQAMDELANRVLAAAGGSWADPPQVSSSELGRLGGRYAREARRCVREALDTSGIPEGEPWVWADPRHCMMAPFWAAALELDLAVVHVHRDPVTSAVAIARELDVTRATALTLWERYNRALLVSSARWPAMLLGRHAVDSDPDGTVQSLSGFLDRLYGVSVRESESALKVLGSHPEKTERPEEEALVLPAAYRVLDEILSGLEGVITGDDGTDGSSAYTHLSDLYDAEYYHEYDGGVPYSRTEPHWIRFFGEVADHIVDQIAPRTSFDAGCAIGMLVEALRQRGVDARGMDISEWAINQIPEDIRPYCRVGSITEPIGGHYDLITCIEVLEHLPASDADRVVENLCAHADAVLFSSTPTEFDDPTHLNVETTSYWATLFANHGFFRDVDHDAAYLAPQAILFRKSAGAQDVVSEYERLLWRTTERNAEHSAGLEAEWRKSASRVEELEKLVFQRGGSSDERTVQAFERLVGTEALRAQVAGPQVTGTPDDHLDYTAEDYSRWRASRQIPNAPDTGPKFSIIVPVFDPIAEHLVACIRSVREQTYSNWELVLVNVSQAPHVEPICTRFADLDPRIRVLRCENAGIAENTDVGVRASEGAWIVFLDHDDTLEPHALAALTHYIADHPDASLVYSDEDKLSPQGCFVDPFFKPDWSPDLLRNVNYVCHMVGVRRTLYDQVGGLRSGYSGAQDYDFVLRATAESLHVGHVADILYHWRQHPGSTASDVRFKPDAHSAGRRALQNFALRHLPGAWIEPGADWTTHRVRYPLRYEKVSIIIPFRDQPQLTDACLRSLAGSAPMLPIEVLLVSNQSQDEATFTSMRKWEEQFEWAKVLEFDEPFNFQRLNNWAAEKSEGTQLLFLNNDIEALHVGWLEALAEHAQRPDVGAVGPRLFYPDGLVQHAGVAVGIGGLADHPWSGQLPDAWTPAGPSYWTRDLLAVTAACLMVEHDKFDEVHGFDERFTVCGGDVDLCLRLRERGYWNVMTPFARLVHHESASREKNPPENDVRESLRAYAYYLAGGDPFFNANLTRSDRSCRITSASASDLDGTNS